MRGHRRARARGFTLLEAIVALVVFSIGAFALFGWLSANLITLQRVQEQRELQSATTSALALLRGVNPMETPRGARRVGELEVAWEATPVEQPRDGVTQVGEQTAFQVGLYLLDVRVNRDGEELGRFEVRQIGHRQARSLELEL